MHEFCCHVKFQLLYFHGLVNYELQKELVNSLKMRPGGVHLFLLVNTRLGEVEITLLDVGQGPENVLFNHLHGLVHVVDDDAHNCLLVSQHHLQFVDGVESLSLKV